MELIKKCFIYSGVEFARNKVNGNWNSQSGILEIGGRIWNPFVLDWWKVTKIAYDSDKNVLVVSCKDVGQEGDLKIVNPTFVY